MSSTANRRRYSKSSGSIDQTAESGTATKRKLSGSDIAVFVRENNLHTCTKLFAPAEMRSLEGLNDTSVYIYSHDEKI